MILSSFLLTPAGLFDYFYNPEYWKPVTVYNWNRINFEALVFSFAIGGIIAVSYNLLFRKRLRKIHKDNHKYHWIIVGVIVLGSLMLANHFFILNFMYDTYIALTAGIIYLLFVRSDLIKEIFWGGVIFGVTYTLILGIVLKINPEFLSQWTLNNLSGIQILYIPIEEIIWAMLIGAIWVVVYEDMYDYTTFSLPKVKTKDEPG